MKRTFKKRTRRKTAPGKPLGRELQSQLAKGREYMKKYADTFRALAKVILPSELHHHMRPGGHVRSGRRRLLARHAAAYGFQF